MNLASITIDSNGISHSNYKRKNVWDETRLVLVKILICPSKKSVGYLGKKIIMD